MRPRGVDGRNTRVPSEPLIVEGQYSGDSVYIHDRHEVSIMGVFAEDLMGND